MGYRERQVCRLEPYHSLKSSFWEMRRVPQPLSLSAQCLFPQNFSFISQSWGQQGWAPPKCSGAKDESGMIYITGLVLIFALPNHALKLISQQILNWGGKLGQQKCHLMRALACAPVTSSDNKGSMSSGISTVF